MENLRATNSIEKWDPALTIDHPNSHNSAGIGEVIKWSAQVLTPTKYYDGTDHGGWLWMQTLSLNNARTLVSGEVETEQMGPDDQGDYHVSGIDINFPYVPTLLEPGSPVPPGTYTAYDYVQLYYADDRCTSVMSQSGDGPGEPIGDKVTSCNLYVIFTTWLMYRPPGVGSQFVPLRSFSWVYDGTIVWNGANWAFQSLPSTRIVIGKTGTRSRVFPSWSRMLYPTKSVYRKRDEHTLP